MFTKIAFVISCLAVANAGILTSPDYATYDAPAYTSYSVPALTATSENVYRSPDNLQSISTQSKSIATPFSSSNKHDVRITNPGVYAHLAPVATYAKYAAAPAGHYNPYAAAPAGQYNPYAAATGLAYAKYAAAPHGEYHSAHLEQPHHIAYSAPAPVAAHAYAAPAPPLSHGSSLLGVAYSPAVAVSHMTYSSPVGVNYSW